MKTIRLLTIGNSFSDNALTYFEAMANSTKKVRFEVGCASLGGCSLKKHWNLATYTARHPEYKTYNLGTGPNGKPRQANLQEALAAAKWDFITLQQVSEQSWRPETFQPHLNNLLGLVRKLAPKAKVMLHQTWAYRSDSPFLPQNGLTQELMFERICSTYKHYAAALKCGILPSGEAVQLARRAPGRAFVWPEPGFDYQHAKAPALPRQAHSLAVGWHWAITSTAEGVPEMRNDFKHLDSQGCYLIGCVWFERLSGMDARSVTFVPPEIDAGDAAFLRNTAHDTVRSA